MKQKKYETVSDYEEYREFHFGDNNNNEESGNYFWSYQRHVSEQDIQSLINENSLVNLKISKG